jgi:hypothetical protein
MSQQSNLNSDQSQASVSLDTIEDNFTSRQEDEDAFRYNAVIALDREAQTRVVEWDLTYGDEVDRTTELLNHLNVDSDDVLSAIREHTDLRTTKIGSNLGYVIVDGSGDIIRYKILTVYPNAPSVQIDHEQLEEDLRGLNPE